MQTPWVILLCRFKDSTPEQFGPPGTERMRDLFTSSGVGKLNMVDFFRDMSHGKLDLTGSQVLGWYPIDKFSTEYTGSGTNQAGRLQLIQWAREAAIQADGANQQILNQAFSVVVITSPPTDLFGGPQGAVSGDGRWPLIGMSSLSPSLLGQEMGHVYGLQHSIAASSGAAYGDSWDTMSTVTGLEGPHPYFTEFDPRGNRIFRVGPGLNAANMWGSNWLDTSRVWMASGQEFGTLVELRPLHRRDLPGYLVARVGSYFIELRMPELWDSGIGSPVVLIHEFMLGSSYLQSNALGQQALAAGDSFQQGNSADPFGSFLDVRVLDINAGTRTARIQVTRRARRLLLPQADVQVGVTSDGGGYIIVGGKIIKVPPHSPLLGMVEALGVVLESDSLEYGAARNIVQREAMQQISEAAGAQLGTMLSYHGPQPTASTAKKRSDKPRKRPRKRQRKRSTSR